MLNIGMEVEASTTYVSKSSLTSVLSFSSNHSNVFDTTEYQEGKCFGKYPQMIPFKNVLSPYLYLSQAF